MSKVTLHKKFKPLFKNNTRYNIVTGGRGSAKSFSISTYLCLLLQFESNHTILYTRFTLTSATISIIPEFIEKIKLLGLEDCFSVTQDSIINNLTGSSIIFKGIRTSSGDQTANLKSVQGVTVWVMDEAEELIDEEIFDKINLSIRSIMRPNKVILILNPATKVHWIYKRFFEVQGITPGYNGVQEDITYIHTSYLDNIKNLNESFISEVEYMKLHNLLKFNHIIMGGWLDTAEGVIFTNWAYGEFDTTLEYGYGADFGFKSDPTTVIKVAIDKKKQIIYLSEELYKPNLTTSEIYDHIKDAVGNKEIIGDNSEPRLIEELKRKGINIKPCVKGAGSIGEGIKIIQDYKLVVTPDSYNIAKELNNYCWSDRKSDAPIDMYNHCIDAVRYRVSHQLKNPTISKYYVR